MRFKRICNSLIYFYVPEFWFQRPQKTYVDAVRTVSATAPVECVRAIKATCLTRNCQTGNAEVVRSVFVV
jgi:hypothetical protein